MSNSDIAIVLNLGPGVWQPYLVYPLQPID